MKTKKLKYTPDFNFTLIGISSTDDGYKLSWHLSEITNTGFTKLDDLEIIDPRFSEYQLFSIYGTINNDVNKGIKLVSNKANAGFLIEELKNIDYFIIINDFENSDLTEDLIKKLKSISSISAVFKLIPENLKSREKLLF